VARFVAPDHRLTDDEADAILLSRQGHQIQQMMRYTAVGDPAAVQRGLEQFAAHTRADELIVTLVSPTLEQRLNSASLLAEIAIR
jgi:alkanesulfonate monooxygenase SsuD/methylene tetrahydromethanopterin reductase-like flavin-dependent oxidoreductase (luciferase family)